MKPFIKCFACLLLVLLLPACAEKSLVDKKASSTTAKTRKKSHSSVKKQVLKPEEYYSPVIANYKQLIQSGHTAVLDSVTEETMLMKQVAEISENGGTTYYAFYDINQDQVDELLIGDSDMVNAIYTVKDDKPVFVKAAGIVIAGGSRSSLEIYQDGTLLYLSGHSINPNWGAISYQIKDSTLSELSREHFVFSQKTDFTKLLGISSESVDLKTLTWNSFLDANQENSDSPINDLAPKQADVASLAEGNIDSIKGTWVNSGGAIMEITETSFTLNGTVYPFTLTRYPNKTDLFMLQSTTNPLAAYLLLPAGDSSYSHNGGSDTSQDRFILASIVAQSGAIEPGWSFYRQ